ncbi:hypothetical protein AAU61_04700 [Desulfocarbo indianensis]|nr:hypothetical protein AAU61_04700 [Desulfocarbo indianensis]
MTRPVWQRVLNLGLAGLCLLGAVLLILELAKWPFLGAASAPPAKNGKAAPTSPARAQAASQAKGNPFARTPQASSLPVTSAETGITVYGVIIGPEGSQVLARPGGGSIQRFKPGQSLAGFQIKEVRPDRLVLQKGDNGPTQTIHWLKKEDYVSHQRPTRALPGRPQRPPPRADEDGPGRGAPPVFRAEPEERGEPQGEAQ